jgi:hypothetical protein
VIAQLQTLCGCVKYISVSDTLPDLYIDCPIVPESSSIMLRDSALLKAPVKSRRFEYRSNITQFGQSMVSYVEILQ